MFFFQGIFCCAALYFEVDGETWNVSNMTDFSSFALLRQSQAQPCLQRHSLILALAFHKHTLTPFYTYIKKSWITNVPCVSQTFAVAYGLNRSFFVSHVFSNVRTLLWWSVFFALPFIVCPFLNKCYRPCLPESTLQVQSIHLKTSMYFTERPLLGNIHVFGGCKLFTSSRDTPCNPVPPYWKSDVNK